MKKTLKKLSVRKETLRELPAQLAQDILGGYQNTLGEDCFTSFTTLTKTR